jgi:UDP-N-acetylglucosamine:LPS N-acetylglucosamine transferase
MKSIMLGKPMILVPIPDHTEQYGNAKRASELGTAEIIPQREVTAERLLSATRKLLDSPPDGLRRVPKQIPLNERVAIEIEVLAHKKTHT